MQSHRGRIGRGARTATATRSLALLLLATACGVGEDKDAAAKSSPTNVAATVAGVVAPAKVEVIADLTGCKVKIRTEADELREGVCHTRRGDYLTTTFPQEAQAHLAGRGRRLRRRVPRRHPPGGQRETRVAGAAPPSTGRVDLAVVGRGAGPGPDGVVTTGLTRPRR